MSSTHIKTKSKPEALNSKLIALIKVLSKYMNIILIDYNGNLKSLPQSSAAVNWRQ
jgi:hypothetical protein